MHDIEPHYHWLELYSASEDKQSPFFNKQYNEFSYTNKIYNYFIHPQWDEFGSNTLYIKLLYADYPDNYAIIELIGEWNDALTNDIMFLKRQIVDHLIDNGIYKFILLCEHVLNFHGSDDCYYEEWFQDVQDEQGWICFVNTLEHVDQEMSSYTIQYYVNFGQSFNNINWRKMMPQPLFLTVEQLIQRQTKALTY